jgi:aldehyde dehydrogenase (NAD+)
MMELGAAVRKKPAPGGFPMANVTSAAAAETKVTEILERLGLDGLQPGACGKTWTESSGPELASISPRDGSVLGVVRTATANQYDQVIGQAQEVFLRWRMLPAPARGQIVRAIGEELRANKDVLGTLVTLETGKILAEGKGEVQEMIDIADFAVGLSRQLYGLTMPSERSLHRMYEQWHPLGLVGVISAFNFPVAVWSWNALLAAVCGDCVVWKPSPKTPLTAIAVQRICQRVLEASGWAGVFSLVIGSDQEIGERLIQDKRVPLISATGSTRMGRHVGETVARRFGRSLLELGGNNGLIVMRDANLDLALRAALFGAVGTAGQRCTTIRRLFLERSIAAAMRERLIASYSRIRVGDPLGPDTLVGPLIDEAAIETMRQALEAATQQGGRVLCGGERLEGRTGFYVRPAIVEAHPAWT